MPWSPCPPCPQPKVPREQQDAIDGFAKCRAAYKAIGAEKNGLKRKELSDENRKECRAVSGAVIGRIQRKGLDGWVGKADPHELGLRVTWGNYFDLYFLYPDMPEKTRAMVRGLKKGDAVVFSTAPFPKFAGQPVEGPSFSGNFPGAVLKAVKAADE